MFEAVNSVLSGIIVPFGLIFVGIFYSIKLKGFHLLRPLSVVKALCSQRNKGGVSSAKALTLALAGTLGVGNIVGVTSAIYLGGAGAIFWMWLSALVAMILKYAEIALAIMYRKVNGDGAVTGGAMYYILAALESKGMKKTARALAAIFSILFLLTSLSMGGMLQAKAITEALEGVFGVPSLICCFLPSLLAFFIIRKGTRGISALTDILVPLMSAGYVILSLAVIVNNRANLGDVFHSIFHSAFSPLSAFAGVGGYTLSNAIRFGVMRGLVSNEAGCGTAPSAHALAQNTSPAKQGMFGILEVFIDTILLCTVTALAVLSEYEAAKAYGGNYMMMTVAAYSASLGRFAAYFIAASVVCFGFATILCWAHYGLTCAAFLSASPKAAKRFTAVYCLCVALGAIIASDIIWQLSDLFMGAMTVINLFILVLMSGEIKKQTEEYFPQKNKK